MHGYKGIYGKRQFLIPQVPRDDFSNYSFKEKKIALPHDAKPNT